MLPCVKKLSSLGRPTFTCSDKHSPHKLHNKATIFLFLGLRISWPEKRVGRSGKKQKQNSK